MNIQNILNRAIKTLNQFNIKNAHLDSEVLLAKVLNKDRNYIMLNLQEHLDKKYLFRFNVIIQKTIP